MNLKFRFAFLFTVFVFIIQMASVFAIYLLYEDFRKEEFSKRLKAESIDRIQNVIQNSSGDLSAYKPSGTLSQERIAVYNSAFQLVQKHPASYNPSLKNEFFKKIRDDKNKTFIDNDRDGLATVLNKNNQQVYIVVTAKDIIGKRKIENLQYILFFTVLGALILSGLFAFLYIHEIIKPLGELNEQMQRISESNLTERVNVQKNTHELKRTAETFNAMLNRLQQAFETRKSFVHHASHELRTPLASMLAQTEAALNKDQSPEEYKKVLKSLAEDQQELIDLTNSLLLLSQFESLSFSSDWLPLRVDELLYETIEIFKFQQKQANINLDFRTFPEDSSFLTIRGNNSLIISAFRNLIKNACLYSDDCKVSIYISADENGITIEFENTGKQITEKEQRNLFIPFFRAANSVSIRGTGLGLSIVQRIIHIHKGEVSYEAVGENINRFTIYFGT